MQSIRKHSYPASTLDPEASVFVSANAGSGKTSLLTARVLALLLHGVTPSKILCLTFTNGAAAEMSSRIVGALGKWVMMEEAALVEELSQIVPPPIGKETIRRARSLFATVLDAPVGLRLQTIHGFCQSLLARFPLEAGVGTHLSVIDATTQAALLKEARMHLFATSSGGELHTLVQELGEHSLLSVMNELVLQKRKITRFIQSHHGLGFALREIYKAMDVPLDLGIDDFIRSKVMREEAHLAQLRKVAGILHAAGKDTNLKMADALVQWSNACSPPLEGGVRGGVVAALSEASPPPTPPLPLKGGGSYAALEDYAGWMLVEGRARKTIFTKGVLSTAHEELLLAEQAMVERAMGHVCAMRDAAFTASLLSIGATLIAHYDQLKQQQGLMDFDDQIIAATRLLSQSRMSEWVMYKLDGGIDHVLVDEAQDTSPEQWEIVRAITAEFFAGEGQKKVPRSLFVVGDEKQSIFRFQGADPAGLATNRHYFLQQLQAAGMKYEVVSLTHSFRSAAEILTLVDKVFESEESRKGLSMEGAGIAHQATREVQGFCELWPLAEANEEYHQSAEAVLARQIAAEIAGWVKQGVRAGDVMVLVRRRKAFIHQLSRALKRLRIPVAGVDRMDLMENIAVQDLLAFAQVLLLPEDDLVLAALLKSPLFAVSEERLFALCHKREGSLWQAILDDPACGEVKALLSEFRAKVDYVSPFALFAELLDVRGYRRAFVGRMGEEYDEVLDVFLEQALAYEKTGTPSMQGFIAWLQTGESEIKRDMEQAGGMVRIMTAHAAKGLQAKIVIVADSTSTPAAPERMQWQSATPLATVDSDKASAALKNAKAQEAEMTMEEYRRLLYVALTRAEDRLIVCGAKYGKLKEGMQEGSWYHMVQRAFQQVGVVQENGRIVLGATQQAQSVPDPAKRTAAIFAPLGMAPAEENPPRPLSPSQLAAENPSMPSPVDNQRSIQKGIAVHRMLQYAPAISDHAKRRAASLQLAATYAPLLEDDARDALVSQVLSLVDMPEVAPLFSARSMAEVPVSGMVEWKGKQVRVLGQIDRLAVLNGEVWIIDYKSSARPPEAGAIPPAYVHQMAMYAAVLRAIYPSHRIRAALLWTANARIDWLDEALLDEAPASAYI